MEKKEYYRHNLPHFQQSGQAYFVTWNLKDAVPPKAYARYVQRIEELKNQIDFQTRQKASDKTINELEAQYQSVKRKYVLFYNKLLDESSYHSINLINKENLQIVKEALHFWERRKIENHAYCVMPNHVHWVFRTLPKDDNGEPVYLQEILHSVKRYSANQINKSLERNGALWQKESFDTTIRNQTHLYRCIEYTLNNPVKAGYADDWRNWEGCWFDGWRSF